MPEGVLFFADVAALRDWLTAHADAEEAWLGFHRVRYGTDPGAGVRVQPAADLLAERGWVPGERERVDADRYAVRFAPGTVKRRARPAWAEGRIEMPVLPDEYLARLREDEAVWEFFEAQAPRYKRAAIWWVTSGKAPETRERRITALVRSCAAGERLAQLQRQL